MKKKLVRDKIPEIIRTDGRTPRIHIAPKDEYIAKLKEKLQEEMTEYLDSTNPEELTDILEVIYALGDATGITRRELERMRKKKAARRGGFAQRIILDEIR